jgi:AcrR family transcriptional regulator
VGFAEPPPAKKRSEARERLLAATSLLFYAEGINSVGIERIIKEGQVTLATFYRHFPSKVDLVVAYLHGAHDHICRARHGAGRNAAGARPCPRCR